MTPDHVIYASTGDPEERGAMQYWVDSTFPQAAPDAGVLLEDDALREGIYFPAYVAIGPTK